LNSTIASESGETMEAIRDLYPPSPVVVATMEAALEREAICEVTSPVVEANSVQWVPLNCNFIF